MTEEFNYSEIFLSPQGEGYYTGRSTVWLRLWGCNLQCNGFGQKDPTDPSTFELPWKNIAVSEYNKMEELPVFPMGCDSSYSWAKKFKKLAHSGTGKDIAYRIKDKLSSNMNPIGSFNHPVSGMETHLAFTGGEPLAKHNQRAVVEVMKGFNDDERFDFSPKFITFETNGTQKLSRDFRNYFASEFLYRVTPDKTSVEPAGEIFWSVSPKLFTVSGEKRDKAIKPENLVQYHDLSPKGQLKFVLGTDQRMWDELHEVVEMYRDIGLEWDVYIMPVGAKVEQQFDIAKEVTQRAVECGYHISPRVHTYLFGNAIGT